jgi:cyclin-dependent kinase 12/13
VPREALQGIVPRSADAFDKIEKVGQGTYSNVYKARERGGGRVVALKKVRFDTAEPESVRFMAREMRILRRLDHPNIIRLDGIATSRMHRSIYLVFEFMYSDLSRLISRSDVPLTLPQVNIYAPPCRR